MSLSFDIFFVKKAPILFFSKKICMTHKWWTELEDKLLIDSVNEFGQKWRIVARAYNKGDMKHRSADSLRNRWNRLLVECIAFDNIDLLCDENISDICRQID